MVGLASISYFVFAAFALALSVYYLFEILDVFSRRTRIDHIADPSDRLRVALQVPCSNEPIEVMRKTLTALAKVDYPDVIVQVLDNNTKTQSSGMRWSGCAWSSVGASSS